LVTRIEEHNMFCNVCGNQMPDGSKFCKICGNKLPQEQEAQQSLSQTVMNAGPTVPPPPPGISYQGGKGIGEMTKEDAIKKALIVGFVTFLIVGGLATLITAGGHQSR
jgi:uncharacterized membrane protein YvbJ